MKYRRSALDKLNTLLFWKDTRVTEGEPYTEIRKFDYSSYFPVEKYINAPCVPSENIYDIRDYGAVANNTSFDNAQAINSAFEEAERTHGVVLFREEATPQQLFFRNPTQHFLLKRAPASSQMKRERATKIRLLFTEKALKA